MAPTQPSTHGLAVEPSNAAPLLDLLRRSFEEADHVIAQVQPQALDRPTPCPAFDVRTLVGHMLFAARRVRQAGTRAELTEDGPAVTGLADDAWAPTFSDEAARALAAWQASAATDGEIALPFGTFPAIFVVAMYAVEEATHAWDLAQAIDRLDLLDEDLAAAVLPVAHEIIRPEFRGEEPMPFAAEVPVAPGRPPTEILAGFMGRDPARS